jgi:hypothetical protein
MTDSSPGSDPNMPDELPDAPRSLLPYAIWFGVAMALLLTFLTLI